MPSLYTIADIETALAPYIPLASQITGKDITLDRMRPLMAALGNPEKQLKIIHIAGTSGKTSTTYYIAALLTAAGQKTGMTISPHIDSIAERVQINMQPISAADFGQALQDCLDIIKSAGLEPTYFEILIAFAYWYFARVGVDYVVAETGLGGLHDSTNVAERPDKVCVITDIGFDHMQVLGNTLPEIAAQKAGIIHPGNMVFSFKQGQEVNEVIEARARQQGAHVALLDRTFEPMRYEIPAAVFDLPEFQQGNWLLAYNVFEYMCDRDALPIPSSSGVAGTVAIQVPGRMDVVNTDNKTLIMDGAHNGQKMRAFIRSYTQKYPGKKAAVLLSLKSGKDYEEVLPQLAAIADTLIITTFSFSQDRPLHGINPAELARAAQTHSFTEIITEPDQTKAYNLLLSRPEEVLIITGSFYLIGQLRHNHKELRNGGR